MAFSQMSTWGSSAVAKVKNGVKENNHREQMHQSILGNAVVQLSSLIQMYHQWRQYMCVCVCYLDIYVFAVKYAHMIIPARLLAQNEK